MVTGIVANDSLFEKRFDEDWTNHHLQYSYFHDVFQTETIRTLELYFSSSQLNKTIVSKGSDIILVIWP